ncbi:uncharacterized protein BDZ99DRAFT_167573 [Mytilinidion resinicola]|uniref:Uncharacterized protein n=1 Tax=Mytilinidion resinicola TaxID=574789 RepID=A0A6A6Y5V1_9PEZI|nr:uncharacterized protein BDZ99DRAFT_167573 [Mytilinidion resinicola]KAF2803605.1 hypothetical protein BDZ99DRAFT_167573 [Mytilinidion resinicola]
MEYRRVESHDGAVVRVQEYRRHASSPAGAASDHTSGGRNFAAKTEGPSMKAANRSKEQRKRPRQVVVEADYSGRRSDSSHHVIGDPPRLSRSHAKPVIHQNSPDAAKNVTQTQLNVKNTGFIQPDVPSPPPTPRLGRLPTPDLSDLDETPFCDCCEESSRFKYCTSCGCGIERPML